MKVIHLPVPIQYAFKGLIFLAERYEARSFKVEEVAATENLPAEFLGKIFQKLSAADILYSKRGPRGGYSLSRPPNHIFLADVYGALFLPNGKTRLCFIGLGVCGETKNCPLHPIVNGAEKNIERLFKKLTLEDIKNKKAVLYD